MSAALHLVVTLAICTLAATWVLSLAGALVTLGLDPYDAPIPQALSAWAGDPVSTVVGDVLVLSGLAVLVAFAAVLVTSWWDVSRVRRRHRDVLALVSRTDDAVPGALVVDHPVAVAYCLPGTPSSVVLSTGALRSLSAAELRAVLAHENSHARERHDLVLLPFAALRRCAPRVADAVALLVEMRADDRACREHSPEVLASALHRFTAGPPAGALGITAASARLDRIMDRTDVPAWLRWSALVSGLVLVSTPLSFLVF